MTSGVPDKIGNYKLLEKIGQGGMGALYRALDPKIGRHVAIKLIREGGDSEEMRERLLREARSAGGLKHGNIVTIFELGEHEGMPFIAMEYIQGETLTQFLTHRPAAPLYRKLQIIDQLCAGLHYAHRMGVVHRDIKPANIMIDTEGTVKILDFGIARMGAAGTTMMGMMIGTLNYMAPEQMEGKSVDARADIFSVGAVIYELFTYRPAFTGTMQSEVMYAILHGRPKPLTEACPGLDPDLIEIVDKCLEKKADDRFQDLAALRQAMSGAKQRIERNAQTATVLAPMPAAIPRPSQQVPVAPPPQTPAPSARRDSSSVNRLRTRADQMRAEQIQAHLERGRRALEAGDHEGAFSACEQVFVLEPQNHQALELEERTRNAVEQVWLREAQNELERGQLTSAWLLTERVLGMNADSPRVQTLRQSIEEARARIAEAQERARALQRQLQQAQQELAAGRLDDATLLIDKVLLADPQHLEARTLKGTIAAASVAAHRAEEQARELERRREEAERARIERERQQADAQRQAEAKRQADLQRQADAQRQAEAQRKTAEAQRQAELQRQAEAQRQAAEVQRQAEAQRQQAEAARRRAEQDAADRRVAEMPIRAASSAAASAPTPVMLPKRQPAAVGDVAPSPTPKYVMWGGAAVVALAVILVGARFMNRQPTVEPTQETAPAPVTPSPGEQPGAQPGAQTGGQTGGQNGGGQQPSNGGSSSQRGAGGGVTNPNVELGSRGGPIPDPKVVPPDPDPVRTDPVVRPVTTTTVPAVTAGNSARDRSLADLYGRAKAALDTGAFGTAVSLFDTLQRDEPNYKDSADLLAKAKDGIAASVKQTMDAAAKLEGSGDYPEALRQLERVAQIDPSMAIVAEQAINRVKTRMRTEGTAAFTIARQADALDLVDRAIASYERAFRMLPDGDPNKKIAKDRLDILRARK